MFVGLGVVGAVLAWLEKPWQRDYVFDNKRLRPALMFGLLGTAVIMTVGWCSWQFIFWLKA